MKANVNDVIQVNEHFRREEWIGCLMIVHEAKEWGVIAGLKVPMQGTAYLRLTHDQYDRIGAAALVPAGDVENDTKSDNV